MKEIYFTLPYKKSVPVVRIEYGQLNNKFLVRTFSGKINSSKVFDNSPKEEVFENEQVMLEKIKEIKKGLLESRWVIQNKKSVYQPTFLKTEIVDGAISFEFSVDINPVKLDERKKNIVKDFVGKLEKEIKTNSQKQLRNKRTLN